MHAHAFAGPIGTNSTFRLSLSKRHERIRGRTMLNPFDPKAALLAKHAQHVVLIHFPIALFMAAVVFDLIAERATDSRLAAAAYYNLLTAAVFTVPAVITGLLAWQF